MIKLTAFFFSSKAVYPGEVHSGSLSAVRWP